MKTPDKRKIPGLVVGVVLSSLFFLLEAIDGPEMLVSSFYLLPSLFAG